MYEMIFHTITKGGRTLAGTPTLAVYSITQFDFLYLEEVIHSNHILETALIR